MNENRVSIERLRELFTYEPSTGVITIRKSVQHRRGRIGNVVGFKSGGYLRTAVDGRLYRLHRIAWALAHGVWPSQFIDHKNGDGYDNRLCNLRDVPNQINAQNQRRARSDSTTNAIGALPVHKRPGNWRAQLRVNGKMFRGVSRKSIAEAHADYLVLKRLHHPGGTL